MLRRSILALTLVPLALLALAAPALAGGWAVVTLDSLPRDVRAGQVLHLGFMVRQHGRTPNSDVSPYLSATRAGTTEVLHVEAKQSGPVGHFVLDAAFPSAGTWEWQIVPAPFEGTVFAPLTVLSAARAPAAAAGPQISAPVQAETRAVFGLDALALRWAGAALLVVAAGIALATQLGAFGRRATAP